ncbi:MAG: hypothetical protein AB1726_17705 [Planctomycetota bacterium]
MKPMLRFAPLALALALSACLENEEEIAVHPDGSLTVRVAAKGDRADLSNGYPVPLDRGWRIAGEDTALWLQRVGGDTGSAEVQARAAAAEWPAGNPADGLPGGDEEPEIRLAVERDFASAAAMPEWWAPPAEPYRTAYLHRTTRLDVREAGNKRIFVFERTFHRRDRGPRDVFARVSDALPPELKDKLEHHETITAGEWATIEEIARHAFQDAGAEFARAAILPLYTQGDASLPPRLVPAILAEVREAAGAALSVDVVIAIYESALVEDGQTDTIDERGEDEGARLARGLEEGLRQAIRDTLRRALGRAGVAEDTQNAILFGLEWEFTAYAHSDDVSDEDFTVRVTLPGVVVDGNQDSGEGGALVWAFEGKDLHERDVVLRAVSVLE